MTAAALRPDLFTHLFATRGERRARTDHAATVLSIMLHVSVLAALVWGSTQLGSAEPQVPDYTPIIPIDAPVPAASAIPARSAGSGGGGSTDGPALALPEFEPGPVPEPGPAPDVWHEPALLPGGPPGRSDIPEAGAGGSKDGFAVLTTLPRLLNEAEVKRELERSYPAFLRDAGMGGEVMVWLLLDENGRVVEAEVKQSSGHPALDQAALNVGSLMRFSPGRNREQGVRVWVSVPFRFTTR